MKSTAAQTKSEEAAYNEVSKQRRHKLQSDVAKCFSWGELTYRLLDGLVVDSGASPRCLRSGIGMESSLFLERTACQERTARQGTHKRTGRFCWLHALDWENYIQFYRNASVSKKFQSRLSVSHDCIYIAHLDRLRWEAEQKSETQWPWIVSSDDVIVLKSIKAKGPVTQLASNTDVSTGNGWRGSSSAHLLWSLGWTSSTTRITVKFKADVLSMRRIQQWLHLLLLPVTF